MEVNLTNMSTMFLHWVREPPVELIVTRQPDTGKKLAVLRP